MGPSVPRILLGLDKMLDIDAHEIGEHNAKLLL